MRHAVNHLLVRRTDAADPDPQDEDTDDGAPEGGADDGDGAGGEGRGDGDGDGDGDDTGGADADEQLRNDGWVQRYDRQPLLRESIRMDNGRLIVNAIVAKPGILTYRNADGSVTRELVPASELHNADSLETLAQAPVTLEHPPVDVDSNNFSTFGVGNIGDQVEILKDNGFVRVAMVIRRADAISAVTSHDKRETSPGYLTLIDATSGVDPVFGEYDAIQRGRRYNHLAITERARGGPDIRLRADAAVQILPTDSTPAKEAPMNPLLLVALITASLATAGVPHEDSQAITKPVTALADDEAKRNDAGAAEAIMHDALQKAFDALAKHASTVDGELTAANDALNKLKGGDADDENKHDAFMVAHVDRIELEILAKRQKIDTASDEIRKLDNAGLRRAIVAKLNPELKADSLDKPEFVSAYIAHHASTRTDRQPWDAINDADPKVRTQPHVETDPNKRADADKPKTPSDAHLTSLNDAFDQAKPARA